MRGQVRCGVKLRTSEIAFLSIREVVPSHFVAKRQTRPRRRRQPPMHSEFSCFAAIARIMYVASLESLTGALNAMVALVHLSLHLK